MKLSLKIKSFKKNVCALKFNSASVYNLTDVLFQYNYTWRCGYVAGMPRAVAPTGSGEC
jgi:hypothetical protein